METQERPAWKREATLIASGAIAGFEVVRQADGSYVVGRWGMLKSLPDIEALEAFLVRVGVVLR
jgi:hypothetical protein